MAPPTLCPSGHPAPRHVARQPAGADFFADRAIDWQWSSTRTLCDALDDDVVTVGPALERIEDFSAFLDEAFDEALGYAALRKAESIGHPIGSPAWLENMEARTGFTLRPGKRGPKPKNLGVK